MTRRPSTRSPAAGPLGRRLLRHTGRTLLAAALGAVAAAVAVTVTTSGGAPVPVEGAGQADRSGERPSRAQARAHEPSGGLVARLLPARALPRPGPGVRWGVLATEPHEPRALAGSCHRFPLVSVGALGVAHRAYALGTPTAPLATADHVVARFADPRTAWRAQAVLLAWQAECDDAPTALPLLHHTDLRSVGPAHRYAVAWTPTPTGRRVREDVALVTVGRRIALVRVTSATVKGRAGRDTVSEAVREAADLLR